LQMPKVCGRLSRWDARWSALLWVSQSSAITFSRLARLAIDPELGLHWEHISRRAPRISATSIIDNLIYLFDRRDSSLSHTESVVM
jgi:hypothetical protein